ncbi:MAG: DoxX family protein [Cyanobacteria bacterium]|nr:DoxX family protein [Cyanobacteriota bacterium]
MDAGLLLVRVVFGLVMAAHGSQKLLGWFGGHGLAGTGGFFETLGFRPGRFFAMAAGASELVGGLLVALGLLGPLGPAMIIAIMIVAMATVHWQHGLFAQNGGIEVPLLYSAGAAAIALIGNGAYSLDALLGLSWPAEVVWVALALGVIGGFANLAIRRAPQQAHA